MSPLDSFWNGVLSLLAPVITPDWGKLIVLIPWLLLLLVLGFLALMVRAWVHSYQVQPARGPKVRSRSLRPLILSHAIVVAIGVATAGLAFAVGSHDPGWTGAASALGLVVNVPLLIGGLLLVVGAAGNAARLWGHEDGGSDGVDRAISLARRHPGRTKRVVAFFAGLLLAGSSLLLGTPPGPGPQPNPVAVVPLLLLGLVLVVGATGSAVAAIWPSDPDFDRSDTGDDSALVAAKH